MERCLCVMVTALEFIYFTRKTTSVVTQLSLVTVYLEQLDYRMLKNLRPAVYEWHT